MPNDHHRPISKAEHRAAYEEHRRRFARCMAMAVVQVVTGRGWASSPAGLRVMFEELGDEMAAMSWHYTAAMLAEELGE